VQHTHHGVGAVNNGSVHNIAFARAFGLEKRGENPGDKKERATAIIADEIQRWRGRRAFAAHRAERPRDGNIIDVMPGHGRPRSCLPPTRHAAIDELWIYRVTGLRSNAQSFCDARAQTLE